MRFLGASAICALVAGYPAVSASQVLFVDSFSAPGTRLNTDSWTTEIGPSSYLGRTQLADWVTPGGVGQFIVTANGAQLTVYTFNPTGFSFYGTHAKTIRTFQPTADTAIEFTSRIQLTSLPAGLVFSPYFYACHNAACTDHDEIDIEFVTNALQPGTSPQVQLNRYRNEGLGAGHGGLAGLPAGFDLLAPHDWTIRWSLARIDYLVDGRLLRSETDYVPQQPMQVNVDAWAPAADWAAAFSSSLNPVTLQSQNSAYTARLRSVVVRSIRGTVPDTPTNLTAAVAGAGLNVSWNSPDSGLRPTSYALTFYSGDATNVSPASVVAQSLTGSETQVSIPIPPGTRGTFSATVTAIAGEAGLPSVPVTFEIGACSSAPSQPGGLSAVVSGANVSLSWGAVSGSPTSYVLEAGSAAGSSNLVNSDLGSAATSLVAANVGAGVYFVRVRGKNACGIGPASNEVVVVVR